MMLSAELTFTTTLFGLYSLFQYINQQNEFFRNYFLIHLYWFFYYLLFMFLTIHSSNMLTKEVNDFINVRKSVPSIYNGKTFDSFQGKCIAWTAQDISNHCNDTNLIQSVCIFLYSF